MGTAQTLEALKLAHQIRKQKEARKEAVEKHRKRVQGMQLLSLLPKPRKKRKKGEKAPKEPKESNYAVCPVCGSGPRPLVSGRECCYSCLKKVCRESPIN